MVYLAELQDEHIDYYMKLSSDPELIATMGWKPFLPEDKERFAQFLRMPSLPDLDNGLSILWSIVSAADNKAIGFTSIKGISEAECRAEVGIAIMERECRGKGYGTEALRQVIDYAFNDLGLVRLGLTVFPFNQRAIRSYEKIGFRKTAFLGKAWLLPNGDYADMWAMDMLHDQATTVEEEG